MNPLTRTKLIDAPGRNLGLTLALSPSVVATEAAVGTGMTLQPLTWNTGATAESVGGDINLANEGGCNPLLAVVVGTWPLGTLFEWTTVNESSDISLDFLAFENAITPTAWTFSGDYFGVPLEYPVLVSCTATSPAGQTATVGPIIALVQVEEH